MKPPAADASALQRATALGILVSIGLALLKISTGVLGRSNALIADGIESIADAVTSIIVLLGVRVATRPPDESHPYGHARAETLSALAVSLALALAAGVIAWRSIESLWRPELQEPPAWFTLPVLVAVIVFKGWLSRWLGAMGRAAGSPAVSSDSVHHASDALTSGAALIGISIALVGGPAWASADDWAALAACAVIIANACLLARMAMGDLMDEAAPPAVEQELRALAAETPGVLQVEKSRVRRSGGGYLMDIHIEVAAEQTVREGHDIAGAVKTALLGSGLRVFDVVVHVEPWEDEPTGADPPGSDAP